MGSPKVLLLATLLLAGTASVGAGRRAEVARVAWAALGNDGGAPRGLLLGGRALGEGTDIGVGVEAWARRVAAMPVELHVGGTTLHASLAELGVRVDARATILRARSVGHRGSLAVRLEERLSAARGAVDVPLAVTVDGAALSTLLFDIKEHSDEKPVPPRYDFRSSAVVRHRDGAALDVDGSIEAVRTAFAGIRQDDVGPLEVTLPRLSMPPRTTAESLAGFEPRSVIATYETAFGRSGHDAPRARNIEVAAGKLDGVILGPGDTLSFNAVVGPRTIANGFSRAFQIYKGEMTEGVGGGTCQVSSTLHAAAVYAGLDVLERAPHSRPLGYIPLGLDSTVVYPEVDLRLRNPWSLPVVVHSEVHDGKLTVELMAERQPAHVALARATLKVYPFTRHIEVHPELGPGRFRKKEKGIRGYDVLVRRTVTTPEGVSHVETSIDKYPATPELYWTAPDVDPRTTLPPIAEGGVAAEATPLP